MAGDPECSRHLEKLLGGASTAQIIAFLQVWAQGTAAALLLPGPTCALRAVRAVQALMDTGGMSALSSGWDCLLPLRTTAVVQCPPDRLIQRALLQALWQPCGREATAASRQGSGGHVRG